MNFDPKQVNDNQNSRFDIGEFKVGECDFVVKNAVEHVAKKTGNTSLKLAIEVVDKNGLSKFVDCYLKAPYKIKEFFDAVGTPDIFGTGTITPSDCMGKSGEAITKIDKGAEYTSDKTGEKEKWDDKLAIKYFVSKSLSNEADFEDDITF